MFVPFDSMPPHSRLWIYQANRPLNGPEKEDAKAGLLAFCEEWKAHGAPLRTSFDIQHDRFVILAVDEQASGVSGCSIDGSVRFLKGLQERHGVDFFDRTQVAFADSGSVVAHPVAALKTLFENTTLSPTTITFNNLVQTKAEWERNWMVPAKDSWLAPYLPKPKVAK